MLRSASEAGSRLYHVQIYGSYNTLAPVLTHKEFHVVNKLCVICMSNKSKFHKKLGSFFCGLWLCLIGCGIRYKRALAGSNPP